MGDLPGGALEGRLGGALEGRSGKQGEGGGARGGAPAALELGQRKVAQDLKP